LSNWEDGALRAPDPLSSDIRLVVLSDGRAGHEAQTIGVARALGVVENIRHVSSRKIYSVLAPFGPADPQDVKRLRALRPNIILAAGRRTIPLLRRLKQDLPGAPFTVYFNRPACGLKTADLIIAPRHDNLIGKNVVSPLTPANCITPELLSHARTHLDPRLGALTGKRVAMLIGGNSRHMRFTPSDVAKLVDVAKTVGASGAKVMASFSRRTPQSLAKALTVALSAHRSFVWDGAGDNPYFSMLACADAIIVTADSVNMLGEAAATGAPIHFFAPSGGHPKIKRFIEGLTQAGAIRPWRGALEEWRYEPINSTPMIASAINRAYDDFIHQSHVA